jgi:hypothetical protein
MREWEEPSERVGRVLAFTARRLLAIAGPRFHGHRRAEMKQVLLHSRHNLQRIFLRVRGVVVVSTPKSGRTWLRYMLDHLGLHVQYTHAFGRLEVPKDLPPRLILLHRDPRDTVVSAWYQHCKRRRDYSADLSSFLRDPVLGIEQRILFNLFWAEQAFSRGGCVTSYEALYADSYTELARVARFVGGCAPDPARIAAAVESGAFEQMRALEASGVGAALYGNALRPIDPSDPESYKTREGKVGSWMARFDLRDVAFADELIRRHEYFGRMARWTAAAR